MVNQTVSRLTYSPRFPIRDLISRYRGGDLAALGHVHLSNSLPVFCVPNLIDDHTIAN